MSWTAPRTWTIGELVTKSIMDTYVRDNQNFLFENLSANIFDVRNANVPLSGKTAAALAQVESSTADTDKPSWHQLNFDAAADEARQWTFRSWFDSDQVTGLKVAYTMASANTSKAAVFRINVMAASDGDASADAQGFDTDNDTTVSVPDAAGTFDVASLPITNWDSIASGDDCILQLARIGSSTDDTASGDVEIRRLWFYV